MSLTEFIGRTTDLLAFHGELSSGADTLMTQSLIPSGTGGALCTGIQKLAQRFLLILLLKKGSRQYRPLDGTTFMLDAERGIWRTVADVNRSYNAARLDFTRQLRAMELDNDPLDEILDTVNLIGVTLFPDKIAVKLNLLTKAGSTYTFIEPITVPIK